MSKFASFTYLWDANQPYLFSSGTCAVTMIMLKDVSIGECWHLKKNNESFVSGFAFKPTLAP